MEWDNLQSTSFVERLAPQLDALVRMPRFKVNSTSAKAIELTHSHPSQFSHLVDCVSVWTRQLQDLQSDFTCEVGARFVRKVPTVEQFLRDAKGTRSPLVELEMWRELHENIEPVILCMEKEEVKSALEVVELGKHDSRKDLTGIRSVSAREWEVVNQFPAAYNGCLYCVRIAADAIKQLESIHDYICELVRPSLREETRINSIAAQRVVDAIPPLFGSLRMIWVVSRVYGTANGTMGNSFRPDMQITDILPIDGCTSFKMLLYQIGRILNKSLEALLRPAPQSLCECPVPKTKSEVDDSLKYLRSLRTHLLACRDGCITWKEQFFEVKGDIESHKAYVLWDFGSEYERLLFEETDFMHDRCTDITEIAELLMEEINILSNGYKNSNPYVFELLGMFQEAVTSFGNLEIRFDYLCVDHYPVWSKHHSEFKTHHGAFIRRAEDVEIKQRVKPHTRLESGC